MASCLSQREIVVKRLPKVRGVAAHSEQAALIGPHRAEAAKYRAKE
jgi:hypothetical protein